MPEALVQRPIERTGLRSEPMVRHYPQVRGGVCEFCGVMDQSQPSEVQYTLCPHYKNMQLLCSYCDTTKNPIDVVRNSTLNITDHPTSGELVVCCDNFTCVQKHQARFQR